MVKEEGEKEGGAREVWEPARKQICVAFLNVENYLSKNNICLEESQQFLQ